MLREKTGWAMGFPDLTYEQVTMIGRPARRVAPLEDGSSFGEGVFREWLFDGGRPVWLNYRDEDHTYSVRLVAEHDVPRSGWQHIPECDCHYCSAWRERASGVTRG